MLEKDPDEPGRTKSYTVSTPWTKNEILVLKQYAGNGYDVQEIGEILGRNLSAIRRKLTEIRAQKQLGTSKNTAFELP